MSAGKGPRKVVTFGEIMCRLGPPGYQRFEQVAPGQWDMTFGGAESSVAASVVRFGGAAEFVTALPDHAVADACVRRLRSLGLETGNILRIPDGRMGIYFVERGANQRAGQVIYDRAHSAIAEITADAIDWDAVFAGASWFHTTGITPALSESAAKAACRAAAAAREAGLTVSVDLNFRARLWKWRPGVPPVELAREVMPELLQHVDIVIGNEEDADKTLGVQAQNSDIDAGRLDVAGFASVAEEIMNRFPNVARVATTLRESISATHNNWGAILTARGEQPLLAPMKDGEYRPYEIRSIVDRVGGGDAFAGALIFALNSGEFEASQDALNFAAAASCLAHSINGDFNLITRDEAEGLVEKGGSGRVVR